MEEPNDLQSNHTHSDDEPEFNCAPVKKIHMKFDNLSLIDDSSDLISLNPLGIRCFPRREGTLQGLLGFSTGYVDQDTSGTYDPKRERVTPPATPEIRQKPKFIPNSKEGGEPAPKRIRHKVGYDIAIKIRFESEDAREYLRSITPGPYSDKSGDEQDERNSQDYGDCGRRSVMRRRKLRFVSSNKDESLRSNLVNEESSPDGNKHRGCKACHEIGAECSLLFDSNDYPCAACEEDETDCELLIAPEYKRPCQRCKRGRKKCSFQQDGGKGADTCTSCTKAREKCIAGPLDECLKQKFVDGVQKPRPQKESNRRARPSKRPSSPPKSQPPQTSSSPSVGSYESSSSDFSNEQQQGSVSDMNGSDSAEVSSNQPIHQNGYHASPSTSTGGDSDSPQKNEELAFSNESSLTSSATHLEQTPNQCEAISTTLFDFQPAIADKGIRNITITTSFSHPIIFYHEPHPNNLDPCSWCDSSIFGLWGYSPKQVEVIPHGGEQGYVEVSGGHGQDGKEQTKMCRGCTKQRIRMIDCQHMVEPIKNLDKRTLDLDAISESFRALEQGQAEGEEFIQRVVWCSICVSPALYNCCSKFPGGCGLKLCQICADLLVRVKRRLSKGSVEAKLLDDLVALWNQDIWNRDGKGELRADVEFLLTTGELAGRIRFGLGLFENDDLPGQTHQVADPEIQVDFDILPVKDSQSITTFDNPKGNEGQTHKSIRNSSSGRLTQPEPKKQKTSSRPSASTESTSIKHKSHKNKVSPQTTKPTSSLEHYQAEKPPKEISQPKAPSTHTSPKPGSIHLPLYIEDSPPPRPITKYEPVNPVSRKFPIPSRRSKPTLLPENSWIRLPRGLKQTLPSKRSTSTKSVDPSSEIEKLAIPPFKRSITSGDNRKTLASSQRMFDTGVNTFRDKHPNSNVRGVNISGRSIVHKIELGESAIPSSSGRWDGRIPSNATVIELSDDDE